MISCPKAPRRHSFGDHIQHTSRVHLKRAHSKSQVGFGGGEPGSGGPGNPGEAVPGGTRAADTPDQATGCIGNQ